VATTYAYDGANQLTQVKDATGLVTASYAYDANHNRTSQTTSAGTTSYSYDAASDTELTSLTNPSGKVTSYVYDTNGNLTRAVYDASGANQVTTYGYDSSNRLTTITEPTGTAVAFTYDADGHRASKRVTSGTTTTVNDVYQLGHLAEQTDGAGTMLASFSYDAAGVPTSVQVGSDPATAPRYYYVYNGHGDVVALTDASGTSVAAYAYDAWGVVQMDTEHFANGWRNPYLYDGRDGARYDTETGLYWLAVRAYDPTLGRFLSHDPLGRAPLFFADQPYAYAGNNPLLNVDPSGARMATSDDAGVRVESAAAARTSARHAQRQARVYYSRGDGCGPSCRGAHKKAQLLEFWARVVDGLGAALALVQIGRDLVQLFKDWNSVAGLEKTIDLAVDTVSVLADVASLGVGVAVLLSHWFNVSGWVHAFHVLAAVGQFLASALKAFRSASGWLIGLAKVAWFAAVAAFKTATSEVNVGPLVLGIGLAVLQSLGYKIDYLFVFDAILAFIQGGVNTAEGVIDVIQGTSDAEICRRYGC
jgi:RHS repeat-associated protein